MSRLRHAKSSEYNVPVEAVLEATDYCTKHKDLLDAERVREVAEIKNAGRDNGPTHPSPARRRHEYLPRR